MGMSLVGCGTGLAASGKKKRLAFESGRRVVELVREGVTPRGIVTLLRYIARQPWGGDFIATLPVAGVDGTLEGRMTGSAASGLIEAKTGEIEHVRALSGYATTLRGESLVFSIFYNNDPQHGAGTAIPVDSIATAMIETLGPSPPASKK
jgi:D-alanyl-D-alanine carboxypeptidase/D-alanyl-D-alanine-endopeptidase (penicillin-binding protein 4)